MYRPIPFTIPLLTSLLSIILLVQLSSTAPIDKPQCLNCLLPSVYSKFISTTIKQEEKSDPQTLSTEISTADDEDPAMIPHSKDDDQAASNAAQTDVSQTVTGEESKSPPPGVDPNAPAVDEARPTANSTTGNSTSAFSAFKLNLLVEMTVNFKLNPIFEDGVLTGVFNGSVNSSSLTDLKEADDETWYKESPYLDRIAFQFRYTPDSNDYVFSKPTVYTTDESGISPEVHDYRTDSTNGMGTFTILYKCKPGAQEKSRISLHMPVTSEKSVDMAWIKECGHGRHEHVEFGYTTYDHNIALFNPDGTYGTEEKKILEIGPLDLSTELTMKLTPPAQNLNFLDPHVQSDSESVSVYLRGTISKGSLSSDETTKFSVLYDCKAATRAQITFSVAIPPWDNITTTWRKDCGGNSAQSLLIGTTAPGSFDVMLDGELDAKYNVSDTTTMGSVRDSVNIIPVTVNSERFYLTNSDETSDIHIQTISTTMSDPNIVSVYVKLPLLQGSSYLSSTGGTLARRETKSLQLHFICKNAGKSLVLVTLPTLRYKNVEFGFIKECIEPKALHHSGFLSTAGSILGVLLLLCIGATGFYVYRRKRSNIKYAAVPTDDTN